MHVRDNIERKNAGKKRGKKRVGKKEGQVSREKRGSGLKF